MNNPSWLVQIYEMADDDSRRWVARVLSGVKGLTVDLAVTGSDRLLNIGCSSQAQALAVYRFVATVDPAAVVINTRVPVEPSKLVGTAAAS